MASTIAKADILDELVGPAVTDADITEADTYLGDLITSLDDEYTISDLVSPTPYKVKKLLIAFVCREVCARKAGAAPSSYRNQNEGDKWSAKLPYFQEQVSALEAQMSIDLITGEVAADSAIGTINIGRG